MGNNYEIKKELGRGGFGRVFLVQRDNRYYALKKISIRDMNKDAIENSKKEINILKKFNNDNIVKYYDSFEENDYLCIWMEYAGDYNLKNRINEYKNRGELMKEQKIKYIVLQICLGLKNIHKANIIHRDLTPENIFIKEDNKIKIGDFGVSKKLETNKYANTVVWKYQYYSPELTRGEKYDYRADIYALGCIIYELFTLNTYYSDKIIDGNDGVIDLTVYNNKWQELIENLLKKDYHQRPNAEKIYNYIINIENKIDNSVKELSSFLINFKHEWDFDGKYNNIKEEQKKLIINLCKKGLISDIIPIFYEGKIVAYKLFPDNFSTISNNWIHAFHGTSFRNLESIILYGLKLPGTKLKNGKITPKSTYSPKNAYGVKNWENAIFSTPCFACASVFSVGGLSYYDWKYPYSPCLVEILIKPGEYTSYKVKEIVAFCGLSGMLYCGYPLEHNDSIYRITSEKNIIIKSIIFLDSPILYPYYMSNEKNNNNLSTLNNLLFTKA